MKNLRTIKVEELLKNELIALEGGSVNSDRPGIINGKNFLYTDAGKVQR